MAIPGVAFVESPGAGQAAAVNAAVERANGDLIAILEDDDYWRPDKAHAQIRRLNRHDLITCDHAEVDVAGRRIGLTQFPTPSGWLMRRSTWMAVGGFDERLRFHIDNDWLRARQRNGPASLPSFRGLQSLARSRRPCELGSAGAFGMCPNRWC